MQSNSIKAGFLILVLVIFGGAVYWMYGPNSAEAKQSERLKNEYGNYVKSDAEIISLGSNGRLLKGSDKIYTLQFQEAKTQNMKTAKVAGRDVGWEELSGKKNGEKVMIYYDPKNPETLISDKEYNERMK